MVATPNLQIVHLDPNSASPEVPVNLGMDAFDAAITKLQTFAVTNTNALAITQAQLAGCFTVQLIPGAPIPTALVVVTVAAFPRGDFIVDNTLAKDCTIGIAAQAGPVPYIKAGTKRRLTSDGVNISEAIDPTYTVA